MGITLPQAPPRTTSDLFSQGNYAAVARDGDPGDWETWAARGLIGKAGEALEHLPGFRGDGPAFHAAVARWIEGDDDGAIAALEPLAAYHAHARNLLGLIRKPRLRVLAQLPWSRAGCSDLLTGIAQDEKFKIENISFHAADLPNTPYADVRRYVDPTAPPDFYICQMVEWHAIPPNLAELTCPLLGHTADYDLHIQTVHPWLQLFDELVVTDPSEWLDVRRLAAAPVSTFPKSFGLPASLPQLSLGWREWDVFLSGTVTHAYHPDKALLLHQLMSVPEVRLKIINGFRPQESYHQNLASSKVCVTYVRHATATPTRGLESLAMGCAVITQAESTLTLFAGEAEGVTTYTLMNGDLPKTLRNVLGNWSDYQQRSVRGADLVRREFALPRVASQYLRFLTFLAARPRNRTPVRYADGLVQKRVVLVNGWLPDYDFDWSLVLKRVSLGNHTRLMAMVDEGPSTSHPYLDAARESVLYNYHRARNGFTPPTEWLRSVTSVYRRGLAAFPRSLPLRFNFIRVLLHFGGRKAQKEALRLLDRTLRAPASAWTVDVMEDVFPWDFCPQLFNYRGYFDLITRHLTEGCESEDCLKRLIFASLHYYRGFFAPYDDFHSRSITYLRRAVELDSAFPYYQYHYARELLQRGLPADDAEACAILERLLQSSILLLEAFELLERLAHGVRPRLETPGSYPFDRDRPRKVSSLPPAAQVMAEVQRLLAAMGPKVERARAQFDFAEKISPETNRTDLVRAKSITRGDESKVASDEMERLREQIRSMESSKFWRLRNLWFRFKGLFSRPANKD